MAGTDHTQPATDAPGPAVVLVHPQLGENIGTTARAMWNCGLADLRLVAPRDGWPSEKAVAAASGADVVLDKARVFATTAEAVADIDRLYATTARRRDMVKPVFTPRGLAGDMRAAMARGERVGILFGAERSGLVNEDVMRAHGIVTVPLNPAFTSLNLAQAVLLIGYEWYTSADATPPGVLEIGEGTPATQAEIDGLLEHLDHELTLAEYYREPNLRPTMQKNLHNVFRRAGLTEQEVRSFRGVVARLAEWRGRRPPK
ncbi:MAG: RNA methyltransferase [Alphaproteobacteria bacterium]|nr:RNA methyltransferase [Alphaproteobacteria bacterium]MCB9929592.1 RNA methyltransferase [Alphaproteobacteria bacterium]